MLTACSFPQLRTSATLPYPRPSTYFLALIKIPFTSTMEWNVTRVLDFVPALVGHIDGRRPCVGNEVYRRPVDHHIQPHTAHMHAGSPLVHAKHVTDTFNSRLFTRHTAPGFRVPTTPPIATALTLPALLVVVCPAPHFAFKVARPNSLQRLPQPKHTAQLSPPTSHCASPPSVHYQARGTRTLAMKTVSIVMLTAGIIKTSALHHTLLDRFSSSSTALLSAHHRSFPARCSIPPRSPSAGASFHSRASAHSQR